ncbi:transmembrane amino acid transporter protein-domain-containing protein [Cladochytrium replicatum]|nr:transmembrane amino acid transporter protein-domain-containing protein [Cladochytrium replicatum]
MPGTTELGPTTALLAGTGNSNAHAVQNYSSINQTDRDADVIVHVEEHLSAALLEAKGTISSSVINIANTMMGAGMLALPSALAKVGLGLGSALILLAGIAAAFGMSLLTFAAQRIGRNSSFFAISKITYPGAAIVFDIAIAIKCFGVSVSYLIIWGDLLPKVVSSWYPGTLPPGSLILMKETWVTIGVLGIAPFVFQRHLDSLKYISGLALLTVVYLVFIVVYYYFFDVDPRMPPHVKFDEIEWIKLDWELLSVLPIFVFAYTCHQNVFSVYNELIDNTEKRIDNVIRTSVSIAQTTYQVVGILGYLTFGAAASSNIIGNYPDSNLITAGELAIAFLVLLSYPLQAHPARASIDKVVSRRLAAQPMSRFKFIVISLALLICSYIIAIKVKNLSTVLSLVGATGSTTIGYILPGIFYWRICEDEDIAREEAEEAEAGGGGSSTAHDRSHSALSAPKNESHPLLLRRRWAKSPRWTVPKVAGLMLSAFGVFLMISSITEQLISTAGNGGHLILIA